MDGMDDVNTPPPPMDDVDNMGGDDPMGGPPMGGDGPMDGGPDMGPDGGPDGPMGGEPPMDGGEDPMGGGAPTDGGNDEFMNKFNQLSKEDQVAVEKYTDSMLDDSPDDAGQMPMESINRFKRIIDEAINDVLNDREGTTRPEKKLPKAYRTFEFNNPFKSPF